MEAAQHAEKQGVPLPKLALKHSVKSAVDADIAVTLVGMSSPEEVSYYDIMCLWQPMCTPAFVMLVNTANVKDNCEHYLQMSAGLRTTTVVG